MRIMTRKNSLKLKLAEITKETGWRVCATQTSRCCLWGTRNWVTTGGSKHAACALGRQTWLLTSSREGTPWGALDSLEKTQGCCDTCASVATCHPEKQLCGEAPAPARASETCPHCLLAFLTQGQVPLHWGHQLREGLMGGGPEVGFGL